MKNLLLILSLLSYSFLQSQPLSGTYTINSSGGDFTSFNAAVSALANRGVSGPVVIDVATGNYNEQISIPAIPGSSSINTITFSGQSDSSSVIVSFLNTSTNNFVLRLNGSSYMHFERITFKTNATTTTSRVLDVANGSSHNRFTNNQFIGRKASGTSLNSSVIYSIGAGIDGNVFTNNFISGGIYGVVYRGTTGYYATGTVFENNYIEDPYYRGFEMQWQTEPKITGNRLHTNYNYSQYRAFNFRSFNGASIIERNWLTGGKAEGLILYSIDAKGSSGAVIANNFVQIADGTGLSVSASDTVFIAYNSINVTGSAPGGAAMNIGTGSQIKVHNNICNNIASGYAVIVSSNTKGLSVNYNNYFTNGNLFGKYLTTDAATFEDWKSVSGHDANSLSVDPQFTSDFDLHTTQTTLNGAGTWLAAVTIDFDGQQRNNFPDIGADEIYVPDLEISAITAPLSSCDLFSGETISLILANSGGSTIANGDSIVINYTINGSTTHSQTHTFSSDFDPGDTLSVNFFSQADFSTTGSYIITTWLSFADDANSANDSASKKVHKLNRISSFPYLEGFEGGSTGWFAENSTSNSWEHSAPSGSVLDTAANGTKTWITYASGNYGANTIDYLYSPCFDLSGLLTQPYLSLKLATDLQSNDSFYIEYSTDAETWSKLGSSGSGSGWYNGSGHWSGQQKWKAATHTIPVTASEVRFRFVLSTSGGAVAEGIAVDDIHIYEPLPIYKGASITGLSESVSGSGWTEIKTSSGEIVAAVNANGQNLGNFTVDVYKTNSGVRIQNDDYYLDRNWVAKASGSFSTPIGIRLYFTAEEFEALVAQSSIVDIPGHLGFTKYTGQNEDSTLDNNSGTGYAFLPAPDVEIIPYGEGYYAEFEVGSLSEFYGNGGGETGVAPLPVELVNFSAKRDRMAGGGVLLNWTTASEKNNSGFEVQRTLLEEENWQTIAFIPGAGNSTKLLRYNFTDAGAPASPVCYRLRQIDYDGLAEFSNTACISSNSDAEWRIRWTSGISEVVVPLPTAERAIVYLIDMNGRILREKEISTTTTISTANLPAGVYSLRLITASGACYQEKFVVQR